MKKGIITIVLAACTLCAHAIDNKGIALQQKTDDSFAVIENSRPAVSLLVDPDDNIGIQIALKSLQKDFAAVTGTQAQIVNEPVDGGLVIVGSLDSKYIKQIIKSKKINEKDLKGKTEKYIMTMVDEPLKGVDHALVIAGSDRRGAIYGIYELSEQMGVSPWYFWADVPVQKLDNLYLKNGTYTAGEPAVRYRGIFLNDEAPCLTSWVKNHYGTNQGGHEFYADCFELILRLRGNFMWPAMWSWAFYADDPENSKTADDMGVIMGTSHHEPMARNHQEWARNPKAYGGVWDYNKNKEELQRFFREGVERSKNNEDLITIGMRGDGDAGLAGSDEDNIKMLEGLFADQRQIIKDVTGKKPEQRPQVWALYKEVQLYYNKGLRVPDDVIILISDDNWGDVRKLPNAQERQHKGGWGMYYHVDYVGAPRNSKWLNITPVQNLWEQMQLTYRYGVDKLWVLNVGDLKPMEYPIQLFLDMAWNPTEYSASTLLDHTLEFCAQTFGQNQAHEAARILNLYSKYAGRVTPEMLDARTYNLESGEFRRVCDDWARLELEATRQFMTLDDCYKDAYTEIILFPTQAMANLYDMYYAAAMNQKLAADNNPEANYWADRVQQTFARDKELNRAYNQDMASGKWNGMMTQKHIGYTSWNDNFRADTAPRTKRIENDSIPGGYVFTEQNGAVIMEAPHYFCATPNNAGDANWEVIPYMGRTLGGVALFPYTAATNGASISYKFNVTTGSDNASLLIAQKSTLAFSRLEGHRFMVSIDGGQAQEVNFNARLNEEPANQYSVYYPTVAKRVVETTVQLGALKAGEHTLTISPIEPASVFEKFVINLGGYKTQYLHGQESPVIRK